MKCILFCGLLAFLVACSTDEQTDLNRLNIKGNVVKLEVSTQTTIPISEWLYTDIDKVDFHRSIRNDAVYSFCGQSSMTFDKAGKLSELIVFDNMGNTIYRNPELTRPLTLYNPININVNELADGWSYENDSMGRIVKQKNEHDGNLNFERFVTYNKRGDIDMIVCKYNHLKLQAYDETYTPADTTFFKYTQFDGEGNWTAATIQKRGRLKTDSYAMNVRRQLTYAEHEKQKDLIRNLQSWNEGIIKSMPVHIKMKPWYFFGDALQLEMPERMRLEETLSTNDNLKVYKLDTDSGYFSISVSIGQQDESIYDATDEEANNAMTYSLAQSGIVILKWQGFSIVNVNGKRFGEINYSHYASGGFLSTGDPVVVKILSYQENGTNACASISFGYDSCHESLYKPLIEKILSTIKIN